MLASVIFGSQEWLVPAIALGVVAAVIVVARYRTAALDSRTRRWAASLKGIALALLLACLLEPLWSGQRARPGANLFAVLADNSESLTIRDPQATESRGTQLKKLLTDEQAPWQVRLSQDFELRRYLFDSGLQGVSDFSKLDFDGPLTNLKAARRGTPIYRWNLDNAGLVRDRHQGPLSHLSRRGWQCRRTP
jgi:hypothetical protein